MILILVVDVLQQFIKVANGLIQSRISRKIPEAMLALQYADDTALIANASYEMIAMLKLVLRLFSKVSGLSINYSKSGPSMSGDITTSDLSRYAIDGKETRKTFIHASGLWYRNWKGSYKAGRAN